MADIIVGYHEGRIGHQGGMSAKCRPNVVQTFSLFEFSLGCFRLCEYLGNSYEVCWASSCPAISRIGTTETGSSNKLKSFFSLSFFLSLSLSLSLPSFLSLSFFLSLSLPLFLFLSFLFSFSLSLFLSLFISFSLILSLSLSLSLASCSGHWFQRESNCLPNRSARLPLWNQCPLQEAHSLALSSLSLPIFLSISIFIHRKSKEK